MASLAFTAMSAFGIIFANRGLTGRQVPVVIAAVDIQAREPITIDMVSLAQVSSSSLPPHAFLRLGDLKGYSAVVPIHQGPALTGKLLASDPDQHTGRPRAQLASP